MTQPDRRAVIYRAFRKRGHPAITCLRVAYAWRGASITTTLAEHEALERMQADADDALHEGWCTGCWKCLGATLTETRAIINDALRTVRHDSVDLRDNAKWSGRNWVVDVDRWQELPHVLAAGYTLRDERECYSRRRAD